jgi:hypothetical protein
VILVLMDHIIGVMNIIDKAEKILGKISRDMDVWVTEGRYCDMRLLSITSWLLSQLLCCKGTSHDSLVCLGNTRTETCITLSGDPIAECGSEEH